MLISFIDKHHRDCDKYLGEFRFKYNTSQHDSLKTSPAFLNLGRRPKPINKLRNRTKYPPNVEPQDPTLWKVRMRKLQVIKHWVNENLDKSFQKQSRYYNQHHRPIKYTKEDLVLARCRTLSSRLKHVTSKLNPK